MNAILSSLSGIMNNFGHNCTLLEVNESNITGNINVNIATFNNVYMCTYWHLPLQWYTVLVILYPLLAALLLVVPVFLILRIPRFSFSYVLGMLYFYNVVEYVIEVPKWFSSLTGHAIYYPTAIAIKALLTLEPHFLNVMPREINTDSHEMYYVSLRYAGMALLAIGGVLAYLTINIISKFCLGRIQYFIFRENNVIKLLWLLILTLVYGVTNISCHIIKPFKMNGSIHSYSLNYSLEYKKTSNIEIAVMGMIFMATPVVMIALSAVGYRLSSLRFKTFFYVFTYNYKSNCQTMVCLYLFAFQVYALLSVFTMRNESHSICNIDQSLLKKTVQVLTVLVLCIHLYRKPYKEMIANMGDGIILLDLVLLSLIDFDSKRNGSSIAAPILIVLPLLYYPVVLSGYFLRRQLEKTSKYEKVRRHIVPCLKNSYLLEKEAVERARNNHRLVVSMEDSKSNNSRTSDTRYREEILEDMSIPLIAERQNITSYMAVLQPMTKTLLDVPSKPNSIISIGSSTRPPSTTSDKSHSDTRDVCRNTVFGSSLSDAESADTAPLIPVKLKVNAEVNNAS